MDSEAFAPPPQRIKIPFTLMLVCYTLMFCSVSRNGNPPNKGNCLGVKCFLSPLAYKQWFPNGYHKIYYVYCWGNTEMCGAERHRNWSFGQFEHILLSVNEANINTIKNLFTILIAHHDVYINVWLIYLKYY